MKKILTFIAVLFALVTPAFAYNSVSTNFVDFISIRNDGPFIQGDQNGNINPDKNVTRAEMAQIIYNIFGYCSDPVNQIKGDIYDMSVNTGRWYEGAVRSVARSGFFDMDACIVPYANEWAGYSAQYSAGDAYKYVCDITGISNMEFGPMYIGPKAITVYNSYENGQYYLKFASYTTGCYTAEYFYTSGYAMRTISTSQTVVNLVTEAVKYGIFDPCAYTKETAPAVFSPLNAVGQVQTNFEWAEGWWFRTDDAMTREELALCVYRMLADTDKAATTGTCYFSDIGNLKEESQAAINSLYELGIIKGFSDGTYRANTTCTRAEVIVMLARMMDSSLTDSTRTTVPADLQNHWSCWEIMKVVK